MAVRVGKRRGRASFAAALVTMVGLAVVGGPATSALADPGDVSTATARFLSGEILGLDLDGLVSLGGATATNSGSATPVVDPAGLDVGALGLLRVTVPSGVQVPLTDVLRLGAVNQYAGAADRGISRAAAGAVGDDGAVSTGGSAAFPADATFALRDLLGSAVTGQVADLGVRFGAITGVAAVDAAQGTAPAVACTTLSEPVHCRGYAIADGTLTLTSPAVAGVGTLLTGPGGVSSRVDTAVAALSGPNGLLARALATATGVAGTVGSSGITATVTTSTNAALTTLLTTPVSSPSGAVSVNLSTGVVTADLDRLLRDAGGSGLSSLAPNTELLSAAVLATLTSQVSGVLNAVPARVGTVLDTALNAAQVDLSADVCVAGLPCPANPVTAVAAQVHGTVAQVVAGTAAASVTVRVAGVGVTVLPGVLLAALAAPLTGTLLSVSGAAVPAVATGVTGILAGLSSALQSLAAIISLTGNVQEDTPVGGYREVALRARLLGGGAGVVNLGSAEVGPNVVTDAVPPTVGSLAPAEGPAAGGTPVTVTGGGFVVGATSVTIGGVIIPAADVTVTAPGTLVVTTPGHAPGPVDVTVTTPGGSVDLTGAYTYLPVPPPLITAPGGGSTVGTSTPTFTGTGTPGQVTVSEGAATLCTTSVTDGGWSCTSDVALTAGPHTVTAGQTDPVGNVSVASTPVTFTVAVPATITAITPDAGPVAGGGIVTVTGTGFAPGAVVTVDGDPADGVVVTSATTLTYPAPAHPVGPVDVVVTAAAGASVPFTYTYLAAPTVLTLAPDSGPEAGGQTVTVTGTGFTPGAVVTVDGVAVVAAAVTPTTLTFVTPAHAAGPVDVTVTTGGGVSAPAGYTYLAAPTAASLDPSSGPVAGGQTVTVTGTGFTPGAAVTVDGVAVVAAAVTPTTLTFVTPAHPAGPVDVTVAAAGGTSAPLTYTYLAGPAVVSLDPTSGPVAGGQKVTLTGTGFVAGATAVTIGGVTVDAAVTSPTTLTFVTPAHPAGPVPVTATTAGGTSDPVGYTYLAAPTAASLDPTSGPVSGGQTVTLTGTGFVAGATAVTIGGSAVAATVLSATALAFVTPAHPAGPVDVTVTSAGGTSRPLGYQYLAAPTIGSIAPTAGPVTGGQTVSVTGTGFVPGATGVTIGGVPAPYVVVTSPTTLTFVTPAHPAGAVTVTATTAGGTSDPSAYAFLPVPTAGSLDPTSGPAAGGQTVTVTGTGFVPGTKVTIGGAPAGPVMVVSATSLTVTTPAHPAGPVSVTVTTPGGTSTPALTYTYVAAPAVTGLDPVTGPAVGGQTVTVTGSGFVPGATAVAIGGISGGAVTVTSPTSLTFSTPAHPAGPVPVTVTTAGGTSDALTYTYRAVPSVTGLDPTHGPLVGGTTVTVTGSGFTDGPVVVTFEELPVVATVVSDTELTFVTPAGTLAGPPVNVAVSIAGGSPVVAGRFGYDAPTIDASSPVVPGASATVTGAGWPALDQVTLQLVDADGTDVPGATVTVVTTAAGQLPAAIQVPVPTGTAPGSHRMTAADEDGNTATDAVEVVAAGPATPVLTTLTPDHGPLAGGTTVTVTGSGLTDATTVVCGGVTIVPGSVTGTTLTFTVPAGTTAGPVDVQVGNGGTAVSGTLPYTYDAPVVTVTGPATGGTTTPVTGTGFGSQQPVTVTLHDGNGDPVGDPVAVVTDGTGGFTVDVDVPAAAGTYTVEATDGNGNRASADLRVVAATVVTPAPALTVAFDRFPQGSPQIDTVHGSGFRPGVAVSLVLDGSGRELGPVTPGADGTFAQMFTVSDLAVGGHTITAIQVAPDGSVLRAVVGLTTVAAAGSGSGSGSAAGGGASAGGGLAYTGTTVGELVPAALLMLLMGAFLTLVVARRRSDR